MKFLTLIVIPAIICTSAMAQIRDPYHDANCRALFMSGPDRSLLRPDVVLYYDALLAGATAGRGLTLSELMKAYRTACDEKQSRTVFDAMQAAMISLNR